MFLAIWSAIYKTIKYVQNIFSDILPWILFCEKWVKVFQHNMMECKKPQILKNNYIMNLVKS